VLLLPVKQILENPQWMLLLLLLLLCMAPKGLVPQMMVERPLLLRLLLPWEWQAHLRHPPPDLRNTLEAQPLWHHHTGCCCCSGGCLACHAEGSARARAWLLLLQVPRPCDQPSPLQWRFPEENHTTLQGAGNTGRDLPRQARAPKATCQHCPCCAMTP
jgi:hypothetical protein